MDDILGSQPRLIRRIVALRAISGCLIASGLVAAITLVLNRGFGVSDIWPFLFWSLPFAGGVAAIAIFLMRLYCRLPRFISYVVAALFGAMCGVLWTYFVALVLGPWIGAFSFPVFACWVAGGASGMVTAAGGCTDMKKGFVVVEFLFVVLISLIGAIGTGPFFTWLSGDQNLEVVFVQWRPGPEHLSVKEIPPMAEFPATKLTNDEVAQLEAMGISGRLAIVGSSKHGRGKQSRAVIVMEHQIESLVELAQPDAVEVIYVQQGNEWKLYPPNSPTLRRSIELEPAKFNRKDTLYMVQLADGAAQGGTAFSW